MSNLEEDAFVPGNDSGSRRRRARGSRRRAVAGKPVKAVKAVIGLVWTAFVLFGAYAYLAPGSTLASTGGTLIEDARYTIRETLHGIAAATSPDAAVALAGTVRLASASAASIGDAAFTFFRSLFSRYLPETRVEYAAVPPSEHAEPAAAPRTIEEIAGTQEPAATNAPRVVERVVERQTRVTYVTNPTTVVRETVHTSARGNDIDTSAFVARSLFDAQVDAFYNSLMSSTDGLGESFGTELLTVSGNASIGGILSVAGVSGLADADVPDSITASNYLPLSGGTLTGSLIGTDLTLSGNLTVAGAQTLSGAITIPYLTATSTTATSTFAGWLTVDTDTFVVDPVSNRVGIGTTSPSRRAVIALEEGASISSNDAQLLITHSAAAAYPYAGIEIEHHNSGAGNQGGGVLNFANNGMIEGTLRIDDNLGLSHGLGLINSTSDGPVYFETNASGGGVDTSKVRILITSGGNVGIGTTMPTAQLHTTGTVRFSNFGAGTLETDASGNITVSSDESLKEAIAPFTRSIDELVLINPITFRWKESSGIDTSKPYTGFSAQNVAAAIPEAVGTNPNGKLTLSDRPILATIVNAVKELHALFSDLTGTVASFAKSFTTKQLTTEQLCLGHTCVTEAELRELLDREQVTTSPPPSSEPMAQTLDDAIGDVAAAETPEPESELLDVDAPSVVPEDEDNSEEDSGDTAQVVEASNSVPQRMADAPVVDQSPPLAPVD